MIYATIDVALQGHPKAIKAGAAMYLWTYAMLWSRDQRESGFVPREVALRCAWAPQAENERAAEALVASGLWLEAEGGWDIWNYPQKNDTRGEIEARIAKTRDRQLRYRKSASASDAETTRDKRVAPGSGADADAGVGSDVVTAPEGVQGEGAPEAPSAVRLRAQPPAEVPHAAAIDEPISDEELEAARMAGVTDIPLVWKKFVGTMAAADPVVRWTMRQRAARWQKWYADEIPRQRVARDREAERAKRSGPLVQPVPASGRLWKAGNE